MPTKEILFGSAAKKALLEGVNKQCNAVKTSLGVKGNTVAMGSTAYYDLTKDGYTISKWVQLSDPAEAIGANMIKEVAKNTVNEAGDNTTTAMVLAQAIINEGFKVIGKGANPVSVTKGINLAVSKAVEYVKSISMKIEPSSKKLIEIATISANNDTEIGGKVAALVSRTGTTGIARISESQTNETYLDFVDGIELKEGYTNKKWINHEESLTVQYDNPLILLSHEKINTYQEVVKILTVVGSMAVPPPLIIILPAIEDTALAFLISNRVQRNLPVCVIRAESYGDNQRDIIEDLSVIFGGKIISDNDSSRAIDTNASYFGTCEKILVTSVNTTILGGGGDSKKVSERIEYVRKEVANSKNEYDKQNKDERLARLEGKVGIIYVGAKSDSEMAEKKARVDDSIRSAQAALLEGVVSGGGVTGIRCATELRRTLDLKNKDEQLGVSIIIKALEAPYLQMRTNAGFEDKTGIPLFIDKLFNKNRAFKNASIETVYDLPLRGGYNFKTDQYEDLVESGVIDATKAFRCALQNAASVAATLLTCNCLIVQEDEAIRHNQM